MAAPPARARADYDYLIKLLLIGDSGEPPCSLPLLRLSIRAGSGGLFVRRFGFHAPVEIWHPRSFFAEAAVCPREIWKGDRI